MRLMGGNSSERNKKADNYLYFNEITVVSSIVWLFDEWFDVLFIIWDIWKINKPQYKISWIHYITPHLHA
jgi:hypothetical protein